MNSVLEHLHRQAVESAAFDVDAKEWVFCFTGGIALRIASPWRVISGGVVALGWQDDGQLFGLPAPVDAEAKLDALFRGSRVRSTVLGPYGDLAVEFDTPATLNVFNASSGYEGWQLYGPGGRFVVAQGGGNIVCGGDDT